MGSNGVMSVCSLVVHIWNSSMVQFQLEAGIIIPLFSVPF